MGKTAVVTGGSSGIGKACCTLLSQNGYTVYEMSRSGKDAPGIRHITADVTRKEQVDAAVEQILAKTGVIDALVLSAGMGIAGSVEESPAEQVEKQFSVNFMGVLFPIQAALPSMREKKAGSIVVISSVAAVVPIPYQSMYSATKAALNALVLSLRSEVKEDGIRVCGVMPGDTRTGFTDARITVPDSKYPHAAHAIAVMEKDERSGMPPERIAAKVRKVLNSRLPRPLCTVGFSYHMILFLMRVLPQRWSSYLVGRIYR
ncbi:MAG: SDR family NAD(P)-dependent oxidoreductase [Clostridia bacterium]|nr:SDR family NAD(P)-dependent oxidoreductase [Clostridia bacterium]